MEPKLAYLEKRLSLNQSELRKMVITSPTLFNLSIDNNMEPKLTYLQKQLDIDAMELRELVVRSPQVLSYNLFDNLTPKMQYLEKRFSMSPAEVRSFLCRSPAFIGYDIDKNLDPTIAFFESLLGPERALSMIVSSIGLLKASLTKRLIPRRDRMIEAGIEFNEVTVRALCTMTDDRFDVWFSKK
jgi:hypothetical protein